METQIVSLILLTFGLLFLISSCSGQVALQANNSNFIQQFQKFIIKYNKIYPTKAEFNKRYKIFKERVKEIYKIQKQSRGIATYAIMSNADLTKEEFRKRSGSLSLKQPRHYRDVPSLRGAYIPDNWDWRDKGKVTPPKTQGFDCAACYAFSALGAIESGWAILHNKLYNLSAQQIVDCSRDYDNVGCSGGYAYKSLEYIKKYGIMLDRDYPYNETETPCAYDKKKITNIRISGYYKFKNEKEMKAYIYQHGPIAADFNDELLQYYESGVMVPTQSEPCDPKKRTHSVPIIGFGQQKDGEKLPYWILQNSWGPDFPRYPLLVRNRGACGIDQVAIAPVFKNLSDLR